ncbi:MAG: hypothetical protein MI919_15485 [Holophagales bacterium]|nr:hypothetical protein [Holophagales bacterium]
MPIYEYRCQSCHAYTEELQKMADPPLEVCGECGGSLKRLISAPAVQFKGEGWYVTDYAGKGKKAGGEKGSDSESKSEGKESGAASSASEKSSSDSGSSKSGNGKSGNGKSGAKSEAKSA